MRLTRRDDLLNRLTRVGKAGPLPRNMDKETAGLIDQMQRQIGVLQEALREMLADPFVLSDGYRFSIDARAASDGLNVLTVAQATAEGLPAEDGFVVYRHSSGLLLNQAFVTSWALNAPASPLANSGGLLMYSCDKDRTVLQIDGDAETQEVVATLRFFPSSSVPVGFTARPAGSVPAAGKPGQVYLTAAISPLELP